MRMIVVYNITEHCNDYSKETRYFLLYVRVCFKRGDILVRHNL